MSMPDAAANRAAALHNLRFNKQAAPQPQPQPQPSAAYTPPVQSRDASGGVQSRYYAPPPRGLPQGAPNPSHGMNQPFDQPWHGQQHSYLPPQPDAMYGLANGQNYSQWNPTSYSPPHPNPGPLGNVLVPASPQLNTHAFNQPYQNYSAHVGPSANTSAGNPWGRSIPRRAPGDTLSASSGFEHGSGSHASFSRPESGNGRGISEVDGAREDGPPRKRTNYGKPTSDDPINLFNVPDSPERARPTAPRLGHSPSASESSTDVPAGPSRRIVRGERPPSPRRTQAPESDETRFNRFRMTFIDQDVDRCKAAWEEGRADVKRATNLVLDSSWSPKAKPAPVKLDVTGRVKEVDEATKAQRAAVKEKGKQSMIYQRRNLNTAPKPPPQRIASPSPVKPAVRPASPTSPDIAMPRRKKVRKVVIDSDSEAEYAESSDEGARGSSPGGPSTELRALEYLNTSELDAIQELTGCSAEQAQTIVKMRPYASVADLNGRLGQGKKKAGPAGISPRMFEICTEIFDGYNAVDTVLRDCERIGVQLREAIAAWATTRASSKGKEREDSPNDSSVIASYGDPMENGALNLVTIAPSASKDYLAVQPALLSGNVLLKDYQLAGLNWLWLLYGKSLSCILADEMGLGKTVQVIGFLAHLKERGNRGPHLIIVPSSTLENWCREFERFAPDITIQTYYGDKKDRPMLRQTLLDSRASHGVDDGWEVLITTYNLAQGDEKDRKFFRRIEWDCCVFDEGHVLKNCESQRYQSLLKYPSKWRLLLTGTPLQNNLQELVSLMNFILPDKFADQLGALRAIFKVKGDSKVSLLAQERVSRAKKMMTPFVLRRRKDQVLKDLPKKVERIEWCEMTALQKSIYRDAMQRSRKTVFDETAVKQEDPEPALGRNGKPLKKKTKATARTKDKMYTENSSNILMELRKAALHPMLFRRLFTDEKLAGITKLLLKEPDFRKRGALAQHVLEDMEIMTDAELQLMCAGYKALQKYVQDEQCYLDAGKVKMLLKLVKQYCSEGRRTLVFSQFTQVLDILKTILDQHSIRYVILTGSTPVDARQALVDEFTEDESITVFLLSTRAGGMGINLTAASVVVMYDQDFNPHNDRQAQDRAYRIGQKRNVDVIKLVTKGTIEEDMLRLGEMKLALDEAVAGDAEEGESKGESAAEKQMKEGLLMVLRKQFEEEVAGDVAVKMEVDEKVKLEDVVVKVEQVKVEERADSPLTEADD